MPDAEVDNRTDVSLARLLTMIMQTAADVLGFSGATTSTRRGQHMETVGATDQRLIALTDAQFISGEGPSLATLEPRQPVAWSSDADLQPWPEYQAAARLSGIRASLSIHVPIDHDVAVTASLTLYAHAPVEVGPESIKLAASFASQVGLVIESGDGARETARLAWELTEAMRSRAVIEQAKGMLMAEHGVTADEGFSILANMSKSSNTKLRVVAATLVRARSAETLLESPATRA